MAKVNRYLPGFTLIGELDIGGLQTYGVGDLVTIAKGDLLISDAEGYAGLATALTTTILGVAAYAVNNSAGANGDLDVQVIPILRHFRFIVPVEENAVLTIANVGIVYDINSEDGLKINDTSIAAHGFKIEEIDISTAALAVATYGYAIGHFEPVS